jgi:hypothetical protein
MILLAKIHWKMSEPMIPRARHQNDNSDRAKAIDVPDHGGLGQRLVQSVQIIAESSNDALVTVWVATEDILNYDHRLLDNVIDFGLDQFQQNANTAFGGAFQFDSTATNCRH